MPDQRKIIAHAISNMLGDETRQDDFESADVILRELRAAGMVVEQGWQPIETAPRDGTLIIVYRPKFEGSYIPQVGPDYWMKSQFGPYSWGKSNYAHQPTHWRPLPAPPEDLE